MAWDRVGGGPLGGGDQAVVERRVVALPVPKSGNAVLPIRLRSYRWRLVATDGTSTVQAMASTRDEIEASLAAYRGGSTS